VQEQYFFGTVLVVPGKYWDALMDVAVDNGGYVTPALVAPFGVPAVELRKMVSRGTLESAGHGVYRVPSLPIDRYDEFILARLWAAGRGVISHDSALLIHELCDINPTEVHLTIPTSYRISRAGGERYAIHHADLDERDVKRLEAVVVTTIRRTLQDVVGSVPTYLVRQAVESARGRGAITADEHDRYVDHLRSERV
jgi:predicted transcriptional regulator of viral defense system